MTRSLSVPRAILVILVCSLSASVFAGVFTPVPGGLPGRYIVMFDDGFQGDVDRAARELATKHNATLRRVWKGVRGFSASLDERSAMALSRDPRVLLVEQVTRVRLSAEPVLPNMQQNTRLDPACVESCTNGLPSCTDRCRVTDERIWHLDRLDQDSPILDGQYNYCTTGSGIDVYVVDTGVMKLHSEFKPGQVVAGYSTEDDPGMVADDPCSGWPANAVNPALIPPPVVLGPYDRFINIANGLSHGTAVASLVAGKRVGVAKDARIVSVKVDRCSTQGGSLTLTDMLIGGLDWIISGANSLSPLAENNRGKSIVTISKGEYDVESKMSAVDAAVGRIIEKGIPVFASANNQGVEADTSSPARFSRNSAKPPAAGPGKKVITVGGSMLKNRVADPNEAAGRGTGAPPNGGTRQPFLERADPNQPVRDARWICGPGEGGECRSDGETYAKHVGSNYGPAVTLFAPAKNITVARLTRVNPVAGTDYRDRLGSSSDYVPALASGTSWSAPLAAGVAARYLQMRVKLNSAVPATVDDVHDALVHTAIEGALDPIDLGAGSPNLLLRAADVMFTGRPTATLSGSSYQLSVPAIGPDALTVQWYAGARGDTSRPVTSPVQPTATTQYWARVSSAGCTAPVSNDSKTVTIEIACSAIPKPVITASSTSVTAGAPVVLNAVASGATTFTWYEGTPGDQRASIGTGTSITVFPSANTSYWVRASDGTSCTRDSAPFEIKTCVPPAVQNFAPATPQVGYRFVGKGLNVHVTSSGTNLRYTWYRGIVGTTSDPVSPTLFDGAYAALPAPDTANSDYSYWVRVEGRDDAGVPCGSIDMTVATVQSCQMISITVPSTVNTAYDQPATLTIRVADRPAPGYRFEWFRGVQGDTSTPLTGAITGRFDIGPVSYITSTLSVTNVKASSPYWVRVTDLTQPTSCQLPAASDAFWIACSDCTGRRRVAINPSSQTIYAGNDAVLSAPETSSSYAYEWRTGADPVDAVPSFGDTASVTVTPMENTSYWVRARIASTGAHEYDSDVTQVTVVPPPPLSITALPASLRVARGAQVSLTVNVPNALYEWREGTPQKYPTATVIGTGQTLTVRPAITTSYWVRVTDSIGWRNSDFVTVTIACTPPQVVIATDPAPPYVPNTRNAILSALGFGDANADYPFQYVWYSIAADGTETIAGQQIAIMPTILGNTGTYRVKLIDACGDTAFSTPVTVYQCLPTIDVQPTQNPLVRPGTPGTLTVHANPAVAGQPAPTYEWFELGDVDAAHPIGSGPTLSVTLPAGVTSKSYFATASGNCNGTARPVRSEVGTISNCANPAIDGQTTSASVQLPGTPSATLSVSATGTSLTYQWYKRESNGTDTLLTGQTAQQITVSPTAESRYWCMVRSQGLCETPSALITVFVCATPNISAQPQSKTIFDNTSTTLQVTATESTATPESYQWYVRNSAGAWVAIAGATGTTYDTPNLTTQTSYKVIVTAGACNKESDVATISICTYPEIIQAPADRQVAYNDLVTLGVNEISPVYDKTITWYRGVQGNTANPVAGPATNGTYTTPPMTATQSYWAEVVHGTCVSKTRTVTINVCIPTIQTQPQGAVVESGGSKELTVGTTPIAGQTFQWYIGDRGVTSNPINGANGASYTATNLNATTKYWVRVTGSCGFADSEAALVTVCQPPAITQQPLTVTAGSGVPAQLSVTATGTNLGYQWYEGTPGTTTTPVGTGSAVLNVTTSVTRRYWVRVSNSCGAVNSAQGWVQVAPSITTQTQASPKYVTSGTPSTFSVVATGAFLTYQWFVAPSTPISGATSASYTTPNLTSNTSLFCRICSGSACVDSNTETAVICLPKGVSVSQPSTVAGSAVTMSIVQPDGNETYTWYQGPVGNTSTSLGAGTSKIVYPTTNTSYWVLNSGYGCTSNSPAINISICQPRIDAHPQSVFVSSGQQVSLTVAATGPAPLAYQWYEGASGDMTYPVSGATGATLSFVAQSGTRNFWCRVTSAAGGACAVNSQHAQVRVCVPPAITSQPQSTIIYPTDTVTLAVGATGDELTYQWFETTSPGNHVALSGQTSSTLVIQPGTTRRFWVRVTGRCGVVDSATALQSVRPTITSQPANTSVCSGGTATFSVGATGSPDMQYRWFLGPVGSTSTYLGLASSVSVANVTGTTSVWVQVSSGDAIVQSQLATATVQSGPSVGITKTYMGGEFVFALNASVTPDVAGYETYQWYRGPLSDTAASVAGPASPSWMVDVPSSTHFWVRVTDTRTGCRTDKGIMVPW